MSTSRYRLIKQRYQKHANVKDSYEKCLNTNRVIHNLRKKNTGKLLEMVSKENTKMYRVRVIWCSNLIPQLR